MAKPPTVQTPAAPTAPAAKAAPSVAVRDVLYRVASDRVVMDSRSQIIPAGTELTPDLCRAHGIDKKWLEDQHREGFVHPVTETRLVGADGQPLDMKGRTAGEPVGGDKGGSNVKITSGAVSQTSGGMSQSVETLPPKVSTPASPWVLDPATLQVQNLVQLNHMIQERDPSVNPFATVEEARAFLSQDFVAPQ